MSPGSRPSRFRIAATLGVAGGLAALPGLVLIHEIAGEWGLVAVGLGLAVGAAALAGALIAGPTERFIRRGRAPWLPCLGGTFLAYPLFAALGVVAAAILMPSTATFTHALYLFVGLTLAGMVTTGWLALPAAVMAAFWLARAPRPRAAVDVGASTTALIFGLALALGLTQGYRSFEARWYVQAIPAEIEVGQAVAIDGEWGIREGCGVAIFRLTEAARERIQLHGLEALSGARKGRGRPEYNAYEAWVATPVPRQLRGIACARLPDALTGRIHRALSTPGNYITHGYEFDLLIIPQQRLVVYGYMG